MKRVVWLLETALFFILSLPLAALPLRCSLKAGEFLGLLLFYTWGSRRRIALENIERAMLSGQWTPLYPPLLRGELKGGEGIARETFKNLGKSFVEILKIYYGLGKKIIDSVEIEGIENFNKAKSRGRGILFLTGHCGNWELMALTTSVKYFPIAIVARPIDNPYVNRFIEKIRQRYGNRVIYKQKALKSVMELLKKGECVGVLMDQAVLPDEGYVIDFLGRRAWTSKMPALIAKKIGAAVLPAFIHRTNGGHKIKIYPEVELSNTNGEGAVPEDTKRFSEYVQGYIKEYPSEWLWIHRRWKRAE
ncbi:MAG: lysophospholipid acyltransferase family protein [Nitrospirota bacterium]